MRQTLKILFLPIYYFLLRTGRNLGLLYKPNISICITTTKNYASQTIPPLLESLINSGISESDIYVFEGGHREKSRNLNNTNHFIVDHNSIDFTALIEVAQIESNTDYWFFIHDTCLVNKKFSELIQNIPHFLPDAMPVKNYPSMNIGLYKHSFLKRNRAVLMPMQNRDNSDEAVNQTKAKAISNEDILFRRCNHPYVYNPWLLRLSNDYRIEKSLIPEFYSNRICEFFPQAGIYKFKANYTLDGKYRINL